MGKILKATILLATLLALTELASTDLCWCTIFEIITGQCRCNRPRPPSPAPPPPPPPPSTEPPPKTKYITFLLDNTQDVDEDLFNLLKQTISKYTTSFKSACSVNNPKFAVIEYHDRSTKVIGFTDNQSDENIKNKLASVKRPNEDDAAYHRTDVALKAAGLELDSVNGIEVVILFTFGTSEDEYATAEATLGLMEKGVELIIIGNYNGNREYEHGNWSVYYLSYPKDAPTIGEELVKTLC